jgi:hypothetical protein
MFAEKGNIVLKAEGITEIVVHRKPNQKIQHVSPTEGILAGSAKQQVIK